MTCFKPFALFALLVATLIMPVGARADDSRDDRNRGYQDRNWHDRGRHDDRGWERNYRENQRYWNQSRQFDRHEDRYGYNNRPFYPAPQSSVVIVNRATPYDRPVEYRTYSNTRTTIYGDGNYTPVPSGTTYYYYSR